MDAVASGVLLLFLLTLNLFFQSELELWQLGPQYSAMLGIEPLPCEWELGEGTVHQLLGRIHQKFRFTSNLASPAWNGRG